MEGTRAGGVEDVPTFVRRRPLTFAALRFALHAHRDDWREADGAPFILHPLEVASLLHSLDCSDEVTAAGVLHDTLEATDTTSAEIRAALRRHGRAPRGLPDRGPRHRGRPAAQVGAARAGRRMRLRGQDDLGRRQAVQGARAADPAARRAGVRGDAGGQRKLTHYWRSLTMLERTLADHPLVFQLRFELEAIRDLPPARTSRAALKQASPPEP